MPGIDEYEPFFDQIRAADQELTAAIRTVDWARIDRARTAWWQAVWQLVAYVLH